MTQASELREMARRLVAAVMTTDADIPQDLLRKIHSFIHDAELLADCDNAQKK